MNQQVISEVAIESVGIVKVSTVKLPDAWRGMYWETAIMWPSEDWVGAQYCADGHGLDIVACDRTQDDADETHQHWCEPEVLARMAHAIVRLALPTRQWRSDGWFGTWADKALSTGGR